MRSQGLAAALLLTVALGGCAALGGRGAKAAGAVTVAEPANARARLYADCVNQASAPPANGRVEKFGHLIRFHCTGAPAKALFEAMEVFSDHRHWTVQGQGSETRYTTPLKWDDQCRRDGEAYSCQIHLNVGPFLNPGEDLNPPAKP